jgi:hypothetical protein
VECRSKQAQNGSVQRHKGGRELYSGRVEAIGAAAMALAAAAAAAAPTVVIWDDPEI